MHKKFVQKKAARKFCVKNAAQKFCAASLHKILCSPNEIFVQKKCLHALFPLVTGQGYPNAVQKKSLHNFCMKKKSLRRGGRGSITVTSKIGKIHISRNNKSFEKIFSADCVFIKCPSWKNSVSPKGIFFFEIWTK